MIVLNVPSDLVAGLKNGGINMEKDSNPKAVFGDAKVGLSSVPMGPLYGVAMAMMEGGLKYGKHNYRALGCKHSTYFDAAIGHLVTWHEGEDIDEESGLHHLLKAAASIFVMYDSILMKNDQDDRPIKYPKGVPLRINPLVQELKKKYPLSKDAFTELHKKLGLAIKAETFTPPITKEEWKAFAAAKDEIELKITGEGQLDDGLSGFRKLIKPKAKDEIVPEPDYELDLMDERIEGLRKSVKKYVDMMRPDPPLKKIKISPPPDYDALDLIKDPVNYGKGFEEGLSKLKGLLKDIESHSADLLQSLADGQAGTSAAEVRAALEKHYCEIGLNDIKARGYGGDCVGCIAQEACRKAVTECRRCRYLRSGHHFRRGHCALLQRMFTGTCKHFERKSDGTSV